MENSIIHDAKSVASTAEEKKVVNFLETIFESREAVKTVCKAKGIKAQEENEILFDIDSVAIELTTALLGSGRPTAEELTRYFNL